MKKKFNILILNRIDIFLIKEVVIERLFKNLYIDINEVFF